MVMNYICNQNKDCDKMSEANTISVLPAIPSHTPASLFFFRASVLSVAKLYSWLNSHHS